MKEATMGTTLFEAGQRVRSTMSVQGMTRGEELTVLQAAYVTRCLGRTYVTYELERPETGETLLVSNGHLLLERA